MNLCAHGVLLMFYDLLTICAVRRLCRTGNWLYLVVYRRPGWYKMSFNAKYSTILKSYKKIVNNQASKWDANFLAISTWFCMTFNKNLSPQIRSIYAGLSRQPSHVNRHFSTRYGSCWVWFGSSRLFAHHNEMPPEQSGKSDKNTTRFGEVFVSTAFLYQQSSTRNLCRGKRSRG